MKTLQLLLSKLRRAPKQTILQQPAAIAPSMDASTLSSVLRNAESGNMADYFSLARDVISGHGHTLTEFGKRKLAVIGKPLRVTAPDESVPWATTTATSLHDHLVNLPSFMPAMVHLLDSTLYPVSVVEKIYRPSSRPGWRYEIGELRPVPYHLLDYSAGRLRIQEAKEDGTLLGTYREVSDLCYIVHRGHLLQSLPDTWGGPMRAVMFWWLFATQDRDWWIRFLERFGAPFMVGKYDETNPESRVLLQRAFSAATRLFGIAIPNDADVQIHQANSTQGGDAFERFHKVACNEISKIILGQTSSADVQSGGGLNSGGQASVQADVREDIRQYDTAMLAATIRTQLIIPLFRLNAWPELIPNLSWGAEDNQTIGALSEAVSKLSTAGIELTDEGIESLTKSFGLPFRRAGLATLPQPLSALSADRRPQLRPGLAASDRIAATAADDLAQVMAQTLSPIQRIVDESTSLSDLSARLTAAFPNLDHAAAANIAMLSLTANAVNAVDQFPTLSR